MSKQALIYTALHYNGSIPSLTDFNMQLVTSCSYSIYGNTENVTATSNIPQLFYNTFKS